MAAHREMMAWPKNHREVDVNTTHDSVRRGGVGAGLRAALLVLALLVAPMACAQGSATTGPAQVIQGLHKVLIKAMKAGSQAGFEGRYDLLQPVVKRDFDFPFIANMVLGTYWSRLTPAEHKQFITTLRHYTISNYASQFNSYNGERFTDGKVSDYRQGIKLVRTQLIDSSGTHHDFVYMLHQTQGHWRIVNVIADGVSDLSLKRSQYQSVLKNQGFATLIHKLQGQIKRMGHPSGG